MMIDLNDIIPLATIIGAASAPTLAAIWAEKRKEKRDEVAARKVAEVKEALVISSETTGKKLDGIHSLVNSQLTEAVDRLDDARKEIADLKAQVKSLVGGGCC